MNETLRNLYAQKYRETQNYGVSSQRHVQIVKMLIQKRKWETMLDYGCGQAVLSQEIPGIVNYDFAIPKFCHLPNEKFDASFCIDVLEHIPEDDLHETLEYLRDHSGSVYFCIHLGESIHKLPDGQPCHLTVRPANWWIVKLGEYFRHIELASLGALHLTVIASNIDKAVN